jgi:Raf kinase inhibitor-like YbhB/YbcL family protein
MIIRSPAFYHEGIIPTKYTCDGDNISPPIAIDEPPARTVSFVIIMDDPDAPGAVWDHWILYNIPGNTTRIGEGTDTAGVPGTNSWGHAEYSGPCPPQGEHRYLFKVFALDTWLHVPTAMSKADILELMRGHILERTTLMGSYQRIQQ